MNLVRGARALQLYLLRTQTPPALQGHKSSSFSYQLKCHPHIETTHSKVEARQYAMMFFLVIHFTGARVHAPTNTHARARAHTHTYIHARTLTDIHTIPDL